MREGCRRVRDNYASVPFARCFVARRSPPYGSLGPPFQARANRIAQCDAAAFRFAGALAYVGLADNTMLRSTRGLGTLPALTSLDVSRCAIDDVDGLRPLASNALLTKLRVSGNPIVLRHGQRLQLLLRTEMPQLRKVRTQEDPAR